MTKEQITRLALVLHSTPNSDDSETYAAAVAEEYERMRQDLEEPKYESKDEKKDDSKKISRHDR